MTISALSNRYSSTIDHWDKSGAPTVIAKGPPFSHHHHSSCESIFEDNLTGMVLEGGMRPRSGSFVSQHEFHTESLGAFTVQVLIPFLICGFGNLGAGQLLDMIQHWPVFLNITELYVLVPSLMGLKGNLEMTMAARLSTAVSLDFSVKF